jgi:hypothetical protein
MALARWVGRAIGLDVHRDFCVVAICKQGEVRAAGRVPSTPEDLQLLADSLAPTDRVALEVTGSCWEVVRILAPHVDRVVVVSCGRGNWSRCGCPTSAAACCVVGWRDASSSFGQGPRPRT